ncbi:hypothetical protein AAE02nite_04400 [Adhaeribacter aerolatus]|uniref:DUF1330 domain-containing protein n=1 Tax=Adhaeribacter aerolatus TaxID=670289 RepID=A0A512AST7_9BACT|nr:DUF1330 domain-containing protein [Adhaeribacter aerolatus]GEO02776.1 hypothetical protein AAE02nite_04400 [Adhaeribacter aerolatus]
MPPTQVYYTLLVYIREGQESIYQDYENKVLPLLPKYKGKLELRLKNSITSPNHPDEIHVVSFPTIADFEAYRNDPKRLSLARLFEASVAKAVLIQGIKVDSESSG